MPDAGSVLQAFVVAAGLGAVVGLERQAHPSDLDDVHAGARTFALYALWGAGMGLAGDRYGGVAFGVGVAAFAGLVLASYVFSARQSGDWGTTTEAAAFVTFLVGLLTWEDLIVPAVALSVGTAAVLRIKEPLHALVRRFSEEDVRAALQFGVITAIVLPLIPDEDLGPFDAINFRDIWLMVVFVSGIGFLGYVALRVLGTRGLGLTGLLGGLVSSTAVTLGFARMSRRRELLTPALAAGILGAGGLMYARVLVWAVLRSADLATELIVPLSALFAFVMLAAAVWWFRSERDRSEDGGFELKNPLTLTTALQFGGLYGAIVFVSKALTETFSDASLNVVGAVSGINDVDAITLSTGRLVAEGLDPSTGARVVLLAVTVNTLVKAGLAIAIGSRRLGMAAGAILGVAAAGGLIAWFLV